MKKIVEYKVNGKEWEEAQDKAFNKLNKNAKIDGFRPGKAPRNIFEKKYGKQEIYTEAADELIQKKYTSIIVEDKVVPIVEPKVDIVKLSDTELEVNFTLITKPEVKLGEYKNLKVKKGTPKVTKEEINHQIEHICEDFAEIVSKDGKVEEGDITIIDFEGFKDGVPFEGGKAENYQLEIGSHSFIPGFEEGIIGMSKDEEKDLELTFPEDYMSEDLKGQKVIFKVKLHDIKKRVIPEMDKEFFEDLDMEGVDSKEALEAQVKKELTENKEKELDEKFIEDLLEKAASNMEIEIDDEIVESEAHSMYHNFMDRMASQGIPEEFYLKYANTTEEEMISKMKDNALKRVKYGYLLEEIVKVEKIEASSEDVDNKIKEIADTYNISLDEVLKQLKVDKEEIKYNIEMEKAIELLKENN
jgi:trigger factor